MYCKNCGKPLNKGASVCPHCGAHVNENRSEKWTVFADTLAEEGFSLAKCLTWIFGIGMTAACLAAGIGCLLGGCYMLFFFVTGSPVVIPALLSTIVPEVSITGIHLLFGGIAEVLTSLLLFGASYGLFRSFRSVYRIAHAA